MLLALFFVLVLLALLTICAEFAMRIRLTARGVDKMAWWRRGGDEVAASYEVAFPGTRLPFLRRLAFWIVLMVAGVVFVVNLLRHH